MAVTRINPLTVSSYIAPTEVIRRPLENYTVSTIQKAEPADSKYFGGGLFSAPQLTPPEFACIQLVEELYDIGTSLMKSSSVEIKSLIERINNHMIENAKALQEASAMDQEQGFWAALKKMGVFFLGAFNIIFGSSLVLSSTSPVLGTTLIASGALSIANLAVTETVGWTYVANRIAGENEDLKNKIRYGAPTAIAAASALLMAAGGVSAATNPALLQSLTSSERLITSAQTALGFHQGFSSTGKGICDARTTWSESNSKIIRDRISLESSQKNTLSSWIRSFVENIYSNIEQVKNYIGIQSKAT